MTIFEVVDAHGDTFVLDAEQHCISGESGGPIVHDFEIVKRKPEYPSVPEFMRFVAPQSVREVPE